jgi:phosphoribosyl-dephospho-CoA transferase
MKYSELDQFRRHRFVWFADVGNLLDNAVVETPRDDLESLRNWVGKGHPLIVRRPCASEDGKTICVGLALPPAPAKRRMAFRLPVSFISEIADPPLWRECMVAIAPEITLAVKLIQRAASDAELPLLTFGSYAWQYHTMLRYVTPTSDIDLLVPVQRQENWKRFKRSMLEADAKTQRTDLEIVMNGDASFNWREFEAPGARMLFKGNRSVWIGDKSTVEALLHE